MSDRQARVNATIPTVQLLVGTYAGTNDDGTVQVDFGQGEITVQPIGATSRSDGEQVRVLRVNDVSVVLGPASQTPPYGTVTADNGETVTVATEGGDYELPYVTTYTPNVSDDVAIVGGWVIGPASAIQSSNYSPPGPPSTGGRRTQEFKANDSGSYRSGSWWTPTVRCSVGNIGCYFYGETIADTIPDAAQVDRVELFVNEVRNEYPASLATFGTHQLATKSGAPVVSGAVTISAGSGWKTLPNGFGDLLKTGAAMGVGTDGGGFHVFAARSTDPRSGTLRITYTT